MSKQKSEEAWRKALEAPGRQEDPAVQCDYLIASIDDLAQSPDFDGALGMGLDNIRRIAVDTKLVIERERAKREKGSKFAYESVEEFEKIVGYKVNSTFEDGWRMARMTNKILGISE